MTLHANAAPEVSFREFISLCLFSIFCNLNYSRNLCDFQYNDLSQVSYHLDIFFFLGFLFFLSVPLSSFINSQLHSCVCLTFVRSPSCRFIVPYSSYFTSGHHDCMYAVTPECISLLHSAFLIITFYCTNSCTCFKSH